MTMNVSIIGAGYVGLVTGACLSEIGHSVVVVDSNAEKVAMLRNGGCPIYEPGLPEMIERNVGRGRLMFGGSIREAVERSEIVFIAVNTPPRDDGSADLSFVERVAREIAECLVNLPAHAHRLIVDKSTVPVETADKVRRTLRLNCPADREFSVASNPEFLREGSAIDDFLRPDRVVVGVESPRDEQLLRELYAPIATKMVVTDIHSAEIIKHASNAFLATKISFINTVAQIAEASGADVELIAHGMGLDQRIGRSFLKAGIGYGGSCFPKDVKAFHHIAKEKGIDFGILREVEKVNTAQREHFLRKVHDALWVVKNKKIAVWGLSFKPNTDDMRSAPSVPIIAELASEGALLHVYDPVAMEKARPELPDTVVFSKTKEEAADGAEALLILTEWKEFAETDPARIKALLRQPIVLDGRNIFDPETMRAHGFIYYSVGRPPVLE